MRTLLVAVCVSLAFAAAAAAADSATSRRSSVGVDVTLTVTIGGTASGSVTSDPAGVDCGTICSAQFPAGTTVTVKGHPAAGAGDSFSANCTRLGSKNAPGAHSPWCKVTLSGDTTVQVDFDPIPPCVVPNVKGLWVSKAIRRLESSGCRAGAIKRALSRRVKRGRVISQNPGAGWRREGGAQVNLVVSRGRHVELGR